MKTIQEKNKMVRDYYKKANNHVFTTANSKRNDIFNVGMTKNKETGQEYIYSINIIDEENVTITLMKSYESYKQEHKVRWFPVYEKKRAVKKYKVLKIMLSTINEYIEGIVNDSTTSTDRTRHTFKYSEKYTDVINFKRKNEKVLQD